METMKECSKCGTEKELKEFSRNKNAGDNLQSICKICDREASAETKERTRHPATGQRKSDWKAKWIRQSTGMSSATHQGTEEWKSQLAPASKAWNESLGIELSDNVVRMPSTKPRFNYGNNVESRKKSHGKIKVDKSMTREGPGFVYVYQDYRIPTDLKIGSSKEDEGRLSSANTWGCFEIVHQRPFETRFAAETAVHNLLASKRLYANKEIFVVTIEEARNAVNQIYQEFNGGKKIENK